MHSTTPEVRRSIGDVKLLNQQRWARHVAAQQQQETSKVANASTRVPPAAVASPWGLNKNAYNATTPVPTAGALFNRPNPIAHDHTRGGREYLTHPYNRQMDKFLKLRGEKRAIKPDGTYYDYDERNPDQREQLDERGWDRNRTVTDREGNQIKLMPVYGSDWFSVNAASPHKRRIPNTSVVNKIGDLRMPFCCWGVRLTAAQWIWWTNLICFLAHTTMIIITLHMAYWRWGLSMWSEAEHMKVTIFRISQVPTVEVYMNNLSVWSPGYNGTEASPQNARDIGGNEHWLHDNDIHVNFASLTISFFAISAVFHLWALLVGIFERTWFLYWRQLDDAFPYWRWLEYSASASVMAMGIAISIGLREQSILAGIFMLHWATMAFGFLVEYISTPKALVDTTVHYRPVGPYEFALWQKGLPLPSPIERYRNDPTALKIISQDQWTLDRPLYDIQATNTIVGAESDYFVQAQRRQNYFRRMVPHVFGWFTMMSAWIIICTHLEWAKHDLAKISDREIPSWVNGAIYGTVIIFWSFTVPQIIFQYLPPGFYWGSELIYCLLSLTAKLYLGIFLLINVIMVDEGVESALAGVTSQ